MADDEEQTPEEQAARQRASAQDAAAELVRMGIDPRSLGLDVPTDSAASGAAAGRPPGAGRPNSLADDLAAPTLDPAGSTPDPGPEPTSQHSQHVAEPADAAPPGPGGRVVQLRPDAGGTGATAAPRVRSAAPVPSPVVAPDTPRRQPVAAGPLEQLLATTLLARPAPAAPGRLLRTVTRGLLTPDAAGAAGQERQLVEAARSRQVGPRVVTVLAGKGGVGTTAVALGVGSALAALRDDRVVVADLRPGTASLGVLMSGEPAPTARGLARDQQAAPLELASGLRVVDGVGAGSPLRRADVSALLDRLVPEHAFCLLDVGEDDQEATDAALARTDQAVLVTEAGRTGLAAARVGAERLLDSDPFALDLAVHVVVCTRDQPYREVLRRAQAQLEVTPARLVVVPPDPHLGAGEPFDAAALGPATREALLQVAAAVALGERTVSRKAPR